MKFILLIIVALMAMPSFAQQFAGVTMTGSSYNALSDDLFVASLFSEDFETTVGTATNDCLAEPGVSHVPLIDADPGEAGTFNCDYSGSNVLEGTQSMESAGDFGVNGVRFESTWASTVSTGITEIRWDFRFVGNVFGGIDSIFRGYNNAAGTGLNVYHNGVAAPDSSFLSIRCNGDSTRTPGAALVTGAPYSLTLLYDHDIDVGVLYVKPLGQYGATGLPYASCDANSTSVSMNGFRVQQIRGGPSYTDNIRIGPHVSTSPIFMVHDADNSSTYDNADIEAAMDRCDSAAPAEGCVIELLAEDYTEAQFIERANVRHLRGQDPLLSKLIGPAIPNTWTTDPGNLPDSNDNGGVILYKPNIAIWPIDIQDLYIDGNKQAFPASLVFPTHHNGIRSNDQTVTLAPPGGIIQNVTIRNTAVEGMQIAKTTGIVIRGNDIQQMGCWDHVGLPYCTPEQELADECPVAYTETLDPWAPDGVDMGCGDWSNQTDLRDQDNQLGRKSSQGHCIEIEARSSDFLVEENFCRYTVKMGLQTYSSTNLDDEFMPKDGTFRNNIISHTPSSGIALTMSNGVTVEGNTISNAGTFWSFGNVGKGVSMAYGGKGTKILNNIITDTKGSGIAMNAGCGANWLTETPPWDCSPVEYPSGIEVSGNSITGACNITGSGVTIQTGALLIQGNAFGPDEPDPILSGPVVVSGNTVQTSDCLADLWVRFFDDVTITDDNTFTGGGTLYGFHAQDAVDLTVADPTDFVGSNTALTIGLDIEASVSDCTIGAGEPSNFPTPVANDCL